MPGGYEQGKAALDELIQWAEANDAAGTRNEATTRLRLIDGLLMQVLGWPKSQITAEEPAGTGRIDYSSGAPAVRLIIEAKREGAYFRTSDLFRGRSRRHAEKRPFTLTERPRTSTGVDRRASPLSHN